MSDYAAQSMGEYNDWGNVLWCMAKANGTILHTPGRGWMVWTGTHWDRDESAVIRFVTLALKERATLGVNTQNEQLTKSSFPYSSRIKSAVYLLQSHLNASDTEFRQIPYWLNVKNGVVDLKTCELISHHPSQRNTYCIDIEYDPGAESELWETMLTQWIGDDVALRQYLHRLWGYTITAETSEEILIYIYGPSRSGKGTMLNTIQAILGPTLAASTDMDTFIESKGSRNFALATLVLSRFVQAQETKTDQRLNTALLKSASAADPRQVERKYHAPYVETPVWKIWLASNFPPKAPPDDAAFWDSRMRVIPFRNSNLGNEDKTLKQRLLSKENKRGILAWLIRGAMAWYKHGLGPVPASVSDTTQEMRSLADSLGRWLSDRCSMDADVTTTLESLNLDYNAWCEDEGVQIKDRYPKAELHRRLLMRGLYSHRTTVGGRNGSKATIVRGVKLKSDS